MLSKNMFLAGVAVIALSGCVTAQNQQQPAPQTQFVTASEDAGKTIEYVPVPVPVAEPYLKKLPSVKESMVKANKVSPEKAIEDARKAALQKSTPAGFINAMQVFDYMPGALYEVYASPGYITSILLKPGENLIAKTSGDTVRWIMGETTMGAGKDKRIVLIVKPLKPNLSTNMMVTTDERIYMIETKSVDDGVYNASVSWNYPHDELKDLEKEAVNSAVQEEQVVAGQVNIDDLNYEYAIETVEGKQPEWLPVEVFDDGYKTYIRFANTLGTTKAPVLYVLSDSGETEIVNYRVRGNFYVIDRIVSVAELRLGKKDQQIVRITRQKSKGFFDRIFGTNNHSKTGLND